MTHAEQAHKIAGECVCAERVVSGRRLPGFVSSPASDFTDLEKAFWVA